MADKWTALNTFWNRFGIPAYDEHSLPDNAVKPYITYEAGIAGFNEQIPLTASVWYSSNSWREISQKVSEIESAIGGGFKERYDGGTMWVTTLSPFAQRLGEESNDLIRGMILQIAVEYQ